MLQTFEKIRQELQFGDNTPEKIFRAIARCIMRDIQTRLGQTLMNFFSN